MLIYKNFTISKNQNLLEKYPDFVLVLEDESGNDWYDLQKNFEEDTLKFLFDKDNRIVSYNFDVSMLTPTNLSVAEISKKKLPDDFFTDNASYSFINGKIKPFVLSQEDKAAKAESNKQFLLSEASNTIAPFQDAVDLDMATDKEIAQLKEWKKYRVLLNRVDTTVPDIDWPVKPA